MISDYAGLQVTVAQWLPRPDMSANIPTAIALAEAQINRSIINRQQEQRATATVLEYLPFPTDYLQIRDIQLNVSGGKHSLEMLSPREIDRLYSSATGEPKAYALIANQIQFGPAPDGTYTVEIDYVKKVPALSGTATTNWFLTDHPDVYLAGTQANLLQIGNDPAAASYLALFHNLLNDVNAQDRRQRWAGPPLIIRPA